MASIPFILPPNISKGELLLSTQVYDVVDLISEGPIYGLVDASGKAVSAGTPAMAKGIYLNDAPLMDSTSNQVNYQNFDLDFRLGYPIQTPLTFPKNTSKEKIYQTDLFGKWDWSDVETLDTRKVNQITVHYGKWQRPNNDPNKTTVIDEDIYPPADPTFVFHEVENSWVDKVRINVTVDALYRTTTQTIDSNGLGRHTASWLEFNVEYCIRNKDGTLGSATTKTTKIQGLVESSAYGYSLEIDLPQRADGENVRFKIYRKTAETASPVLTRKLRLDSVIEIISKLPFTYPQSVLAGWTLDARTFRALPQRSYHIRGKLIRVPSNYYPLQDAADADLMTGYSGRPYKGNSMDWRRYGQGQTYSNHTNGVESGSTSGIYPPAHIYRGNWDGTFKYEWTDNPAWILYDLLINDVYGLGNFIDPNLIDKWTLYQIGRYCDAVDDAGFFVGCKTLVGGREPRYSCNTIIEQEQEAFTLVNYIAGIFRGIAYWANGGIYFADDRPKDPVMYFGNADVKEGVFNYQDTIKNGRFTVCEVAYNDREDNFLPKVEYVEDADGILSLGIIKNSIQGFGTTSRSEARRLGLYQIYSSQQEPELVNFTAGGKAMFLRPGDVIGISDEVKQLGRYNGVITDKYLSANRLYLNLDAPLPTGVVTGTNIIVTLPWGFNTLEDLNAASTSGVPRYAIEGSRTKQYMVLPVQNISTDRQTIDLAATGIEIYNSPEPTSGDYLVNTGINISRVPLTEAYKYIPPFSLYVAQTTGMQHGYYRVITIAEKNSNEYDVGCVEYDSGKFYRLENEELGFDNSNDELFGEWSTNLNPPNPVKSINLTKQNPTGALFDVNVTWVTPTTPPSLAGGAGVGQPDPYKVTLTDPNGTVYTSTTTGLSKVFTNLAAPGYYQAKVWSVGGAPNYLSSIPSSMSKYVLSNSFTNSGVTVESMSLQNSYSGTYASGSGIIYSTSADIVANWLLLTPDNSTISNGQDTTSSSFLISQNVYFTDATGGAVTGLTRSGYTSTSIDLKEEELVAAFGYYPRDFTMRVEVSGALAPETGTKTGYIQILNPYPVVSSVLIEAGNGLQEWTPTGSTEIYPDPISGSVDFTVNFDYSGYGDVSKIHLHTGDYLGFPIDSTSLYTTIEVGTVAVNSQSFIVGQGMDESGTLLADPFYFGIVIEDSIGTGAPFTGTGIYANYIIDNSGNYLEEIDDQINSILNSGQLFMGQKIYTDVVGILADPNYGTGALGIGLPLEDWTTIGGALQALYPSGDCFSGSGVFPREMFHMGTGKARFDGQILLPRFTKAQLTGAGASGAGLAAAQNSGGIVICTNVTSFGILPVYSNGTGWMKVTDGLVIT